MRICFIGHEFHRRTRSSDFFVEILNMVGEVTELHADPDGDPARNDALVRTLIGSRFDCYIFWQTERVAERLLPLDLGRTFIVPMFDSSGHVPDAFWLKFVKHHILSFTRVQHERLQRLGCATSYFQYFPEPGPEPDRAVADARSSAFFWERQPRSAVNFENVLGQCEALGVRRLLLHAAPDFTDQAPERMPSTFGQVEVDVSRWFDSREGFDAAAGDALFFFAPRLREGIGMASLEAMARGQIVVAPDYAATNEYVAHLTSGLLYDPDASPARSPFPTLDSDMLARMSRAARRKAVEGRRTWIGDVDRLTSILRDDGRRWSTGDDSAHFGRAIRSSARARAANAR
jgi:hypothetical protein